MQIEIETKDVVVYHNKISAGNVPIQTITCEGYDIEGSFIRIKNITKVSNSNGRFLLELKLLILPCHVLVKLSEFN